MHFKKSALFVLGVIALGAVATGAQQSYVIEASAAPDASESVTQAKESTAKPKSLFFEAFVARELARREGVAVGAIRKQDATESGSVMLKVSEFAHFKPLGDEKLYAAPDPVLDELAMKAKFNWDNATTSGRLAILRENLETPSFTPEKKSDPQYGWMARELGIAYLLDGKKDEALKWLGPVAKGEIKARRADRAGAAFRVGWLFHSKKQLVDAYATYQALYDDSRSEYMRAKCLLEQSGILLEAALNAKGSTDDVREFITSRLLPQTPNTNDPDYQAIRARGELILVETYYHDKDINSLLYAASIYREKHPSHRQELAVLDYTVASGLYENDRKAAAMDVLAAFLEGPELSTTEDQWGQESSSPWSQSSRMASKLLEWATEAKHDEYMALAQSRLKKVKPPTGAELFAQSAASRLLQGGDAK